MPNNRTTRKYPKKGYFNRLTNAVRKGDIHNGLGPLSVMSPYNMRRITAAKKYRDHLDGLGHPYTQGSTCRNWVRTTEGLESNRILYSLKVNEVPKMSTTFALNAREKDVIDVRGLEVMYSLRNNTTVPLFVNMALIAGRDKVSIDANNFFRGNGASDRATNFGADRSPIENHMMAINSDDYIVLRHMRWTLAKSSSGTGGNSSSEIATGKTYIPINKHFRFDSQSEPHQSMWLVWWCDTSSASRNDIGSTNRMQTHIRTVLKFKNVT